MSMAVSTSRDHFFQTSTSLEEVERRSRKASNLLGHPIKLPSKILAIASNPYRDDGTTYIAESAATIKQIDLSNDAVKRTYRGPGAPLTSLCFSPEGAIYAGCWDKTIWLFPSENRQPAKQVAKHTDFVKCLLRVVLADKSPLLISGGAEGDILFWSPTSPDKHVLRLSPQSRGIEHLALDPLSPPEAPVIFVATSQREIYTFALPSSLAEIKSTILSEPIVAHETSVYKLFFDGDGDLWTASADKTAKHLSRDDDWKADTVLTHPDFVRDVVVHERGGWVITACRDEEVRVWNRSTGTLHHTFSGHFEEVTGLCLLLGDTVVSVSIDATVRKWDLSPTALNKAIEEAKNPKHEDEMAAEKKPPSNDFGLTEEEEAELRAMMEGEEQDVLDKMADGEQ